jgi:hypothetical protein
VQRISYNEDLICPWIYEGSQDKVFDRDKNMEIEENNPLE